MGNRHTFVSYISKPLHPIRVGTFSLHVHRYVPNLFHTHAHTCTHVLTQTRMQKKSYKKLLPTGVCANTACASRENNLVYRCPLFVTCYIKYPTIFYKHSPSQVGMVALHVPTPSPLPSIHTRVELAELKPVPLVVQLSAVTVPDLYAPFVLGRVLYVMAPSLRVKAGQASGRVRYDKCQTAKLAILVALTRSSSIYTSFNNL